MIRQWSLRGKLVLVICFIALLVAAISYGLYAYTVQQMAREMVLDNLRSLQTEVENNLATDLAAIHRTAKNIIVGSTVYDYLQDGAPTLDGDVLAQSVLRSGVERDMTYDLLFDAAFDAGLIENVHLYLTDENIAFLSRNNRSTDKGMPSVQAIYNAVKNERFWGFRCYPSAQEDPLIYFAYCLYSLSTDASNRNLYLIFSTRKEMLYAHFEPLLTNDDALFYVTDADGRIIISDNSQTEGMLVPEALQFRNTNGAFEHVLLDRTEYFASVYEMNDGFRSVTLLPVSRLTAGVRNITWRYLILCLCVMVLTILLVLPLTLRLTHFTRDFIEGIRRFGSGDLTVKLPQYHDYDLNEICTTFNHMTDEINTLIKDKYEKQMLLQQMDIAFLQSQMNPHFLFNVLLSISARAKMDGDETLFEMVQSLTTLLQASLHPKQAVKIPLRQELEYVRAYLSIQRLRFGQRISFEICVPEQLQGLLIPRLSVQPLVENAVIHGLTPIEDNGLVRVEANADEQTLNIVVEDNGCGFDLTAQGAAPRADGEHNHIALSNLQKRIILLYGDEYGLELHSAKNQGCRVSLHLPREEELADGLSSDISR